MSETPVRFRDGSFQLKCATCGLWWDLVVELWRPASGMRRCKACWNEYHKLYIRGMFEDAGVRAVANFKGRIRYRLNRERHLAAGRAWRAVRKDHIAAYNRAYRAARKAA